ncbi:MAG: hypothetical protein E4H14_01955 [Candidatus Thorarchaeota archaeon]|nr:MAG: hypothetical protein E4H14_01955 [Candidatus Thorarchaeota archaeon]
MFINPKVAIEQGWIKGIKDPVKHLPPNAIDFTLDKVHAIDNSRFASISEEYKLMREHRPHSPVQDGNKQLGWLLEGARVYDGTSDVYVEIPEGVSAILFTRSTFARNGILIASGLYDSGYKGQIGFTIYTHGGPVQVAPGVRIGQIAFFNADNAAVYAGDWNHKQGTHYTDKPGGQSGVASGTSNAKLGKPQMMEQPAETKQTKPEQLEPLIGSNPNKSEKAQDLEDAHQWDSDQGGRPAGTKTFI